MTVNFWLLFPVLVPLATIFIIYRSWQIRRSLLNNRANRPQEKQLVKVEGVIKPFGKQLTAPLGGQSVVIYSHQIVAYNFFSKRHWQSIGRIGDAIPFLIDGQKYQALVNPVGATFNSRYRQIFDTGFFLPIKPNIRKYLVNQKIPFYNFLLIHSRYIILETTIPVGCKITAIGSQLPLNVSPEHQVSIVIGKKESLALYLEA